MAGGRDEDEAMPDRLLEAHPRQVERDPSGVEYAASDQQRDHRRWQAQQQPWIEQHGPAHDQIEWNGEGLDAAWRLFGISMAGYNAIISLGAAILALSMRTESKA